MTPQLRRLDSTQLPEPNSVLLAGAPELGAGALAEYLSLLNRRKGTLVIWAVVSTLLALLVTKLQTPVYQARTLIEIEDLNEDFFNMRNVSPTATEPSSQSPEDNVRTQIAVMQSRPVLERMLQKNNFEKRLLNASPQSILPWKKVAEAKVLRSPQLLHDRAIALAAGALRVRPQLNTRLVEVSFNSTDPKIAADLANSLITSLVEVNLDNRWHSIQNTSEWLTRQLQDVKVKLEQSEDELQKYAHSSDLTMLSRGETTTSEERLKELQAELSKAEAERIDKQAKYEQARKAPVDSRPSGIENTTLREYQVQLTALRRQLADLSSSFTSSYPKVVSVQAQIATIESALENEQANALERNRNDYESAVRREGLIKTNYSLLVALISQEADKISHYIFLKREVDTTRQLYASMVQRVKEANLASAMKATNVQVIEAANPPEAPYKPIVLLNLTFGLLSGLGIGAVVIIQRSQSSRFQEPGESALQLNVPELGVIPAASPHKPSYVRRFLNEPPTAPPHPSGFVIASKSTPSPLTESFRLTLASILLSGVQPHVIAFTSAVAKEGKSTVTSNLGIALAGINRRVLLVDGDLRKPQLHRIFDVDNTTGLYEALTGTALPLVKETKINNLFLLPSGRGSDGDMLFYPSTLRNLLNRLRTEFDMILIDTPPLLQVADARLICNQADGTVLVISQHTHRDVALLVRQRLADDRSRLLGTILNKWEPRTNPHNYQNYTDSGYYNFDVENVH
jgi:polysaccharide biosynthesis transport protein